MASVRLKKTSRFWYACITLPSGKQTSFSTGLTDKTAALAVANTTEVTVRNGALQPHQLRVSLSRIAEQIIGRPEESPIEWFIKWAQTKAPEVKAITANHYLTVARECADHFHGKRRTSLSMISPADVLDLRTKWAQQHSPARANFKLRVLKMALSDAWGYNLIPDNPAKKIADLKNSTASVRREFRPAELEILLQHAAGEWRAMIYLGLFTVQRFGDLATLKRRSVDLHQRVISFVTEKTGAVLILPIVDPLQEVLLELPSSDDPDSYLLPGIAALSKGARSRVFRALLAQAGLAEPEGKYESKPEGGRSTRRATSELSFHSLRHTGTTMLKATGVSDVIARMIVGHESEAVSRRYTHLDIETMRQAMAKMSLVGRS